MLGVLTVCVGDEEYNENDDKIQNGGSMCVWPREQERPTQESERHRSYSNSTVGGGGGGTVPGTTRSSSPVLYHPRGGGYRFNFIRIHSM